MSAKSSLFKPSRLALAASLLGAMSLSACATSKIGPDGARVGNTDFGVQSGVGIPDGTDPIAEAAFWGTRYDRAPEDKTAATNFAKALRKIGSEKEAVSVLQKSAALYPEDAALQLELGKALVADQRAYQGITHIEKAVAASNDDWQALSAYGVALDQIGAHDEARAAYNAALTIVPGETTVLNNMALSAALNGRLDKAEVILRQAMENNDASAQVRQNLALVLGLKGKFREAERLARADLPPQVADNNLAYFRSMLSQPAYWRAADGFDAEAFSDIVSDIPADAGMALDPDVVPEGPAQPSGAPAPLTPQAVEAAPLTSAGG